MGEKTTTIAKRPEVRESEKNGSESSVRRNSYVLQQPAKALSRQECPVQDAKALKDQPPSQMIILHPPVLII